MKDTTMHTVEGIARVPCPARHRRGALVAAALLTAGLATAPAGPAHAAGPPSAPHPEGVGFAGSPPTMCPAAPYGAQFEAPGARTAKTVALTFDDGPGRSTQAILDILESFHVRATFFNVGQEMVYRPLLVQEEARDGFLLGDHSVDHPDLAALPASSQAAELDGVIHETRLLTQTSTCVFRPPYGDFDATTLSLARSRRMSVWMWNVSTDDWEARGSGSAAWIHHIVSTAESEGLATTHALVLFHNQPILMPATVAALPIVIRFFQAHGYAFVDLLGRTGPPGTCGGSAAATTEVPATPLRPGSTLHSGTSVRSPSGQFVLSMASDGDLTLALATGRTLWSTRTSGHPGAELVVTAGGDVVVRTAHAVLWSTGTTGHRGAVLSVRDDGTLQVLADQHQLWRSSPPLDELAPGERLRSGWRLTSANGRCRLLEQSTGPLTVRASDGQVLWSSGTSGATHATAVLERSGNLVVVVPGAAPAWDSVTNQHGATTARLTNRGTLVVATVAGRRLWATP